MRDLREDEGCERGRVGGGRAGWGMLAQDCGAGGDARAIRKRGRLAFCLGESGEWSGGGR